MADQNKYYCPLIFNQLLVDHHGKLKHCCHYKTDFSTYTDLVEDKITSIDKISNNKPIAGCQVCYTREEQKLPSLRQSEIASEKNVSTSELCIEKFDVRLHQKCNLACSMCNEYDSSLWAKMLNVKQNFALNQQTIDLILEPNTKIKKLSFQGGEPFYGKDFTDFIDSIPNKSKIELEIFTNGLLIKLEKIKEWINKFKTVQIIVSVDGHGAIYDYIRWPSTWNKFETKIQELYHDLKDHITFALVLQNLNANNLLDFLKWKHSQCPLAKLILTVCETPKHFAPKILHANDKKTVIKSMRKCLPFVKSIQAQMVLLQQINTIENYTTTKQELEDFYKYRDFIDNLRSTHRLTDH